jgi:PTH2 family peptidyl-tRNA hydrolase
MKMVFVVRTDLDMGKGKIAAQVAHAAVALDRRTRNGMDSVAWYVNGQKKVVLKCTGEDALEDLEGRARRQGLETFLVHDFGLTQVAPHSATVLGFGPCEDAVADELTGGMKLL